MQIIEVADPAHSECEHKLNLQYVLRSVQRVVALVKGKNKG